jgi:hypothetical protein
MAEEDESESLETEVEQALEEARMVLPGIQALFGFQLIAVFNQRFDQALGEPGKRLHLGAVVLTAIALGLIMAPGLPLSGGTWSRVTLLRQLRIVFDHLGDGAAVGSTCGRGLVSCLPGHRSTRREYAHWNGDHSVSGLALVCVSGLPEAPSSQSR